MFCVLKLCCVLCGTTAQFLLGPRQDSQALFIPQRSKKMHCCLSKMVLSLQKVAECKGQINIKPLGGRLGRRSRWILARQAGEQFARSSKKAVVESDTGGCAAQPLPFLSPLFFYLLQATHLTSPSAIFFQVPPQREVWPIPAVKLMRAFRIARFSILLEFRCFQAAIVKDVKSQSQKYVESK